MSQSEGRLQNYSVDQVAGAFVLCLGAIASLLLVIWQSKCHCKCNLCYIFQCERRPPSEEEMAGLKDQFKKTQKTQKKEDKILDSKNKEEEVKPKSKRTPTRNLSLTLSPEPEPELVPDNP